MAFLLVVFLGVGALVWWWFSGLTQQHQLEVSGQRIELAAQHARQRMVAELGTQMRGWATTGAAGEDECVSQGTRWVLARVPKARDVGESDETVRQWAEEVALNAYAQVRTARLPSPSRTEGTASPSATPRCAGCGRVLIRTGFSLNDDRGDACGHCKLVETLTDFGEAKDGPIVQLTVEMRRCLERGGRIKDCDAVGAQWFDENAPDTDPTRRELLRLWSYEWAMYDLKHAEFVGPTLPANWQWLHRPL